MTFDPDDPRLTAFALGELEGEDRAEVERLLADHPDALRAVEEIRSLGAMLTTRLAAETPTAGALSTDHRRAIAEEAASRPAVLSFQGGMSRVLRYAVAAGALGLVGTASYIAWRSQPDREAALNQRDLVPLNAPAARGGAPASDDLPRSLSISPAAPGTPSGPSGEVTELYDLDAAAPPAATDPTLAIQDGTDRFYFKREGRPDSRGLADDAGSSDAKTVSEHRLFRGTAPIAGKPAGIDSLSTVAGVGGGGGQMSGTPGRPTVGLGTTNATGAMGRDSNSPALAGLAKAPARREDQLGEATLQLGQRVEGLALEEKLAQDQRKRLSGQVLARFKDAEAPAESAPGQPPADAPTDLAAATLPAIPALAEAQPNTEQYAPVVENDFEPVTPQNTLSTFSVDVDTASYANIRRFLTQNTLPPPDSVRIEEMVNYFTYDYPQPTGDVPFSINTEVTRCPWNADHQLLRVGLQGKSIDFARRLPSNLVFLVDVSGSMDEPNKLPLVKAGLRMLVGQLGENDRISIATYAGGERLALPATSGSKQAEIIKVIDELGPGGSTNGAAGINLAYELAVQNFIKDGINRVILCTDGDFNVGVTDVGALKRLAEEKRQTGVFLSVLGFGTGNVKDQTMESIADAGNGQYGYIDGLPEARRVFVDQVGGTLQVIAKDVKIQLDFNPAKVGAYRLVGYENRMLAAQDFANDAKDAGEIGAGHSVTALYELIPPGDEATKLAANLPASAFTKPAEVTDKAKQTSDLLVVKLRWKKPDAGESTPLDVTVPDTVLDLGKASSETKFAASVAMFGMLLRHSKYAGSASLDATAELAEANKASDHGGYRTEFVDLVKRARQLMPPATDRVK